MEKPRVSFCWMCHNKLRNNYHTLVNIDGETKVFHKQCAKDLAHDNDFHKVKDGVYVSWCGRDYVETY